MPAKFGNFRVQADLRKQRCDFSPEAARRRLFFLGRIAQNVSHLFLHTAAVPLGAALQPRLNRPLDITNHKLRHTSSLVTNRSNPQSEKPTPNTGEGKTPELPR